MQLSKYSMGIGDRFAHQGKAQLAAFVKAKQLGVEITPVWNKSNREHLIVHSEPASVRTEADNAVKALNWKDAYFVDADHIGLKTVNRFIASSDFFTIDVADFIGKPASANDVKSFVTQYSRYAGKLAIPGIAAPLDVTTDRIAAIANKYLYAVQEAKEVYLHIESAKGKGNFVPEISMDETDQPQTPIDLLFILAAIASQKIPVQTIAPKFTGRFNKGVDYVGDVNQFEKEFNDDLAVIAFAVKEFGLPADLKLSVHSGSDKFSIYPAIRRAIKKTGAGLHIKTAGTNWLEEIIGLASSGAQGLQIAKDVYAQALDHFDELCGPYATVIDINKSKLPSAKEVSTWTGERFAATVRHDQSNSDYNPNVRQLLHVGYKIAAQLGDRYTSALKQNEAVVAANVTQNLLDRHIRRIFLDN
jgi:tagaturonate epimerase